MHWNLPAVGKMQQFLWDRPVGFWNHFRQGLSMPLQLVAVLEKTDMDQ
jgi:hypothetical protein